MAEAGKRQRRLGLGGGQIIDQAAAATGPQRTTQRQDGNDSAKPRQEGSDIHWGGGKKREWRWDSAATPWRENAAAKATTATGIDSLMAGGRLGNAFRSAYLVGGLVAHARRQNIRCGGLHVRGQSRHSLCQLSKRGTLDTGVILSFWLVSRRTPSIGW